jgi:oligopeptide transport system substrate-binding protein
MRTGSPIAFAFVAGLALVSARPSLAADSTRTLRVAFNAAETGFDPQAINDNYSFMVCDSIFDALYTYDYFARLPRIVPNTAEGMPEISDGGPTFTIKVKPGIFFADDPVFKGRPRELTAEDYVYSIKRIFDPRVRSTSLYIFEHQLVGLDDVLNAARRTNDFDYNTPIEGLPVLTTSGTEVCGQRDEACDFLTRIAIPRGGGARLRSMTVLALLSVVQSINRD